MVAARGDVEVVSGDWVVCVALADRDKDGRTGRVKLGLALLGSLAAVRSVSQGEPLQRGGKELLHAAETGGQLSWGSATS